jgi:hypothetical protein
MPQEDFRYVDLAGIFENVIPTRQLSISKFLPNNEIQKRRRRVKMKRFVRFLNCQILKNKKNTNCRVSIFGSMR